MASVKNNLKLFNSRLSLRRETFRKLKKHDVKSSSFDGIGKETFSNLSKNDKKSSSFDGLLKRLEGGSR